MSDLLDDYLEHARLKMFPMMKKSQISLTILKGDPDPKLCLELGAALLFEKPLIILAIKGYPIPEALRRVADRVVEVDELNEAAKKKLSEAIEDVLSNHWPQVVADDRG